MTFAHIPAPHRRSGRVSRPWRPARALPEAADRRASRPPWVAAKLIPAIVGPGLVAFLFHRRRCLGIRLLAIIGAPRWPPPLVFSACFRASFWACSTLVLVIFGTPLIGWLCNHRRAHLFRGSVYVAQTSKPLGTHRQLRRFPPSAEIPDASFEGGDRHRGSHLCGCRCFPLFAWRSEIPEDTTAAEARFAAELVAKGAQLAALGNCIACHTVPGRPAFAGGLALPTPFGTIYSTNITPDRETGIGGWSEAAFERAMREGVDREGSHLYPAFPYEHFTRVSADDNRALYAFLMTRVAVKAEAPENDLPFPLKFRPLLAGWKLLSSTAASGSRIPARAMPGTAAAILPRASATVARAIRPAIHSAPKTATGTSAAARRKAGRPMRSTRSLRRRSPGTSKASPSTFATAGTNSTAFRADPWPR